MSNLSMCFISVLVVILNASLTISIAQENSSMDKISNMTFNNTLLNNTIPNNATPGNTSLNTSAANNAYVIAKPKSIESMNNTGTNTTINLSTAQANQSDEAIFIIGSNATSNKSAYNIDIPTLPEKNASYLWYVIQAKPHGMV